MGSQNEQIGQFNGRSRSVQSALMVRDVSFRFRKAKKYLFTGISFSIACGERVALSGPNGSGKSTLLRVLVDDAVTDGASSGKIQFWDAGFAQRAARVGLVGDLKASDDYHALPYGFAVETLINIQKELAGSKPSLLLTELYKILKIDALMKSRTDQLSSGQRKRLQLYLALSKSPDLILADEPFENVDVDRSASMPLLREFLSENRIALLLITHRKEEAEFLCDSIYEFNPDGCSLNPKCPISTSIVFAGKSELPPFVAGGAAEFAWRLQMALETHAYEEAQINVKKLELGSVLSC